jgi:hypothetical protein
MCDNPNTGERISPAPGLSYNLANKKYSIDIL